MQENETTFFEDAENFVTVRHLILRGTNFEIGQKLGELAMERNHQSLLILLPTRCSPELAKLTCRAITQSSGKKCAAFIRPSVLIHRMTITISQDCGTIWTCCRRRQAAL